MDVIGIDHHKYDKNIIKSFLFSLRIYNESIETFLFSISVFILAFNLNCVNLVRSKLQISFRTIIPGTITVNST